MVVIVIKELQLKLLPLVVGMSLLILFTTRSDDHSPLNTSSQPISHLPEEPSEVERWARLIDYQNSY